MNVFDIICRRGSTKPVAWGKRCWLSPCKASGLGEKCQWIAVSAVDQKMPALGKMGEEAVVDCTGTVEGEDSGLASLRQEPNHFEDLL